MLKKAICLLFSFLIIISCCACARDEVIDPDKYISEAAVTQCSTIMDANQDLYNKVFVLGHLSYNEKETFEKDGKKYAPVTDKTYGSYADLENEINSIYTEDCAASILKNYNYYADIDGVFCFDLSCKDKFEDDDKWERSSKNEVELEEHEGNTYTLEFYFICGRKDCRQEFLFEKTEAGYRLAEFKSAR